MARFNTVHSLMFCGYKTTKIDLCQIIQLKITGQASANRNRDISAAMNKVNFLDILEVALSYFIIVCNEAF